MQATIQKWGNSQGIRIPKAFLKALGNQFPLHIPLDGRTKTTGVIMTEHMKCLDVVSKNIQFAEKLPEDLLVKTLAYVKAFF